MINPTAVWLPLVDATNETWSIRRCENANVVEAVTVTGLDVDVTVEFAVPIDRQLIPSTEPFMRNEPFVEFVNAIVAVAVLTAAR